MNVIYPPGKEHWRTDRNIVRIKEEYAKQTIPIRKAESAGYWPLTEPFIWTENALLVRILAWPHIKQLKTRLVEENCGVSIWRK